MTGGGERIVALTGATGFVGRQVLRHLDAGGHRVRAFVRAGSAGRLPASTERVQVVEIDDLFAASTDALRGALDGVDTLVHAAWYAEPGKYLHHPKNVDCLTGTLRLGTAFAEAGGRRFAGVGTCFEYDLTGGLLHVDTPLRPATLYASCKVAAFEVLQQLLATSGTEFAWCRLFYLYGEAEDARRLVPHVRSKLAAGEFADLTAGDQVRDYLDVAEAGRLIAETALGTERGAVNVCSGVPVTVRALVERIADEYGRRDLLRFDARPTPASDPPFVVGVRTRGSAPR